MAISKRLVMLCVAALVSPALLAETYYVDFDGGSDSATGTSPQTPLKHCPGDANATATAAGLKLAPGDTVIFKGGVRYQGCIQTASGSQAAPIMYDGNIARKFGKGPAIIDGSVALKSPRRCQSIEEAFGNPNWQKLWLAKVPAGCDLMNLNLCQGSKMLNLARYPNASDEFFYDLPGDWHTTRPPYVELVSDVKITPGEQTTFNTRRPLFMLADGDLKSSTVLNDLANSQINFELPAPQTITAIAIANTENYSAASEFELICDGKTITTGKLERSNKLQRFELAEPVSAKKLSLKFTDMHPAKQSWGAVAEVQAYNTQNINVLHTVPLSSYSDADFLNQSDPHCWDNATVMLHAKPATTYLRRVDHFDAETNTIYFKSFLGEIYKNENGRIALLNAPTAIDAPGEWCIMDSADSDKSKTVLLWPLKDSGEDSLDDLRYSAVRDKAANAGFLISGYSYVTLDGFTIERFAGAGASGVHGSDCKNILLRNLKIQQLAATGRSSAIGINRSDKVIINRCQIMFNRRCSGVILHSCSDSIVRSCLFNSNGSTALDFYGCSDSKILSNLVVNHKGVHANGLTMYAGCKNILVEGNSVFDGNVCLTTQDGSDITIVNNVFDGGGKSVTVGLWSGKQLSNIYLYNNLLLNSLKNDWAAAIYCDNPIGGDFVIRNNVIDGLAIHRGTPTRDHNIYTSRAIAEDDFTLGEGELYITDASQLFVAPKMRDYRLRPNSPAIDAGVPIESRIKDLRNLPVPVGKAPDIGPIEHRAIQGKN